MSLPVDIRIGEQITFPVDLDTDDSTETYSIPLSGVVLRAAAPGSPVSAFEVDAQVTDGAAGHMDVSLASTDTELFLPGTWFGQIVDTAGPTMLAEIEITASFLVDGPIEGELLMADMDTIGENIVVTRGRAKTFYFGVAHPVPETDTVVAIIGDETYPMTRVLPRVLKLELDSLDTAEFDFTAESFQIEHTDGDDVAVVYDAVITVREGVVASADPS